jgi:alpha-D-xyloside xylohydrolase
MAVCGHPFWSHDAGGFIGTPTPELYIRWAQFGLFSPLIRAHGNGSRLPWDFGPQALEIFRSYSRLRYYLMPYIYTYASIARQTSLPILRPMLLEFPDDPTTYALDLQYMFGSELLVAPIFNERGERTIYLPQGRWIDYWSHEILTGPCNISVRVALDVLPLYVRANALIPTTRPVLFMADEPFEEITVDAYLLEHGTFDLHDNDGLTRISAELANNQLRVIIEGVRQSLSLRLIPLAGAPMVTGVMVNGQEFALAAQEVAEEDTNSWTHTQDGALLVYWNQ